MSKINNFIKRWTGRGYEKGETQTFWLQFLRDVVNINQPENFIQFEMQVPLQHTSFIDGYLKDTRVIIEQKSSSVKLDDTVFQQAKSYNDGLNFSRKARWIITCNFQEFLIYDMDKSKPATEPIKILLAELPEKFHAFDILIDKNRRNLEQERKLSFEAGKAVKKLYDTLKKNYINPDSAETFQKLNKLCVRLVFCFYADAAGVFQNRIFRKCLESDDVRRVLKDIFKVLNTPINERDPYDDLNQFPYVNGGLFAEENIEIPKITRAVRDVLLNDVANFQWQDINPTIFGAVFESTLNPNARDEAGIHYTSPENIHKVIDLLFLEDLNSKFDAATSRADLINLQNEIAALTFFDPACGSGNFLTETYISLRELENKIIAALIADGSALDKSISVSIENFYGIEINDFAVAVAKTALWISEIQMRKKTSEIIGRKLEDFPLTTITNIHEGNALTTDWAEIVSPHKLNYIISNPPFISTTGRTAEQKADIISVCKDLKPLDYVTGWYKKANDFISDTFIRCAFVSTNSICQGEQVAPLWKVMNSHIDFAYQTFKWNSESPIKAQVHVVIVSLSRAINLRRRIIVDANNVRHIAHNINGYLINAPNIYIEKREKPICPVPKGGNGNQPTDGGHLIFNEEEAIDFMQKYPTQKYLLRRYIGARDFIHNKPIRYCLWLVDIPPNEYSSNRDIRRRLELVRESRLKSIASQTRKAAVFPYKFVSVTQPNSNYIAIPRTSSENRKYIPMGFLTPDVITSSDIVIIPDAALYHFGVMISSVHMGWMRRVCGRLEMRYRYSASIVYNNFIWCNPTTEQKAKIELTAQGILNAIKRYPDSTLADLYDELTMPPDLRKAHEANDKAVMEAYGFDLKMTEDEVVAALFKLYGQLSTGGGKILTAIELFPTSALAREIIDMVEGEPFYNFGVLTSSVHMGWMRTVAGRLKSDYRYSASIVYNNFVWCTPSAKEKAAIVAAAKNILEVRARYPDATLADLYNELTMPEDLRKAHAENDAAVMKAYGFAQKMTEAEVVGELFKLYEAFTSGK